MSIFRFVIEAMFKLRRDKGKAPHKSVLLLALVQEVEEGRITDNKVYITPELLASFKEIWSKLVTEGSWHCKFFLRCKTISLSFGLKKPI